MKRSFIILAVLLLLLGSVVSACSGPAPAETAADELVPIKLVSLPFLSFAPLHIAVEEGYFEEQELDVELVKFERGVDAYTALLNNELDVWAGGISASLFNAIARSDIRIVAGRGYFPADECGYSAFLVEKDLYESGEITSPADLAGLRIVQDNEGGLRDYGLRMLLEQGDLTLADADILSVPDPSLLNGFMEGSIDLAAVAEPRISTILNEDSAVMWKTFGEVVPDFQFGLIVFGQRFLEEEPELGEKFIAAYRHALDQYNEGKTDRNMEILAAVTGLEPSALEQACWPTYHDGGQINLESVLSFQDWLVQEGYLETAMEAEELYNPEFVD